MRLLIVEKDAPLAAAMGRAFRADGYAVDLALTGEQACLMTEVNDYDIATLALNLPRIDGLEVCRRLRAARPRVLGTSARKPPFRALLR
jgi:DNA-binding response OmpR family regulator